MSAPVIAVVGIFFIIGVAAGIAAVVALSALRADRHRGDGPPEQGPGGFSGRPPGSGPEESASGATSQRPSSAGYWFDGHETRAA